MEAVEKLAFTIEQFYAFVKGRRIMAAKCTKCEAIMLPPRFVCKACRSTNLKWVELEGRGKLLTYTIINVAPSRFQRLAPYVVGIVQLKDGPNLLGMIRGVKPEEVRIGMDLIVDFEPPEGGAWPAWPRYYFKPA